MTSRQDDKKLTMGFMQWLVATVVAAVIMTSTVVVFAYATFQTDEEADEDKLTFTQRLDRIENKVDRIFENTRRR